MGLVRDDLIRRGRDLEMPDEEWAKELAVRQSVVDRFMANDKWIKKLFLPIGILLTSHPGNRAYLKASIESHKKLGFWICLAYDNYIDPEVNHLNYNSIMPAKDVMDNVDSFILPHHQVWGGVFFPWVWLLYFGVNILKDFKYTYCSNGDFVLEKPEGFPELFKLLGDADIMTTGHDEEGRYANTAGFIVKTEALLKITRYILDHFTPFDVYEKYTQEYGNAEGYFGRAIKDLGLRQVSVEPPNDDMLKVPGKGTWYDLVGMRHIHSEHNFAYRNKGIPPHYKYLDERFMGDEYKQIKKYWETKNMEILKNWWAKEQEVV